MQTEQPDPSKPCPPSAAVPVLADVSPHRWPARIGVAAVALVLVGCFGVLIAASRAASPALPTTQPTNGVAAVTR